MTPRAKSPSKPKAQPKPNAKPKPPAQPQPQPLPPPQPTLALLHASIVRCRACPRLVAWREQVAREKRRAYADQTYWGRPITGFGDPESEILLIGLAPGAHGANRTGRIFTGDRSGDFLFAALHRVGLANQPTSVAPDDGLALRGAYIVAPVRCVPPDNKPLPDEIERCAPLLDRELAFLPRVRVFVALGGIAWKATLDWLARGGAEIPTPRPAFGHGASVAIETAQGPRLVLGSYHVSQQNTQTGRLTPAMFDEVLRRALAEAAALRAG
jgi:uracil-DNA glycosylase family 4